MQLLTTSQMPIQRQDLDLISALRRNIESVIFGKTEVVKLAVTCLLARGHVLLEDVPGIGHVVGQGPGAALGLDEIRVAVGRVDGAEGGGIGVRHASAGQVAV